LGRGYSVFIDVPDQTMVSVVTGSTPIALGVGIIAGPHAAPDLGIGRLGAATFLAVTTTPDGVPAFAHSEAPVPVASAVTSALPEGRSDIAGSVGGADGMIGRDSGGLAPLALILPDYSHHGWFMPAASNEYGQSHVAGDNFAWNDPGGAFSSDWFWV
jgi:hypothetical protein